MDVVPVVASLRIERGFGATVQSFGAGADRRVGRRAGLRRGGPRPRPPSGSSSRQSKTDRPAPAPSPSFRAGRARRGFLDFRDGGRERRPRILSAPPDSTPLVDFASRRLPQCVARSGTWRKGKGRECLDRRYRCLARLPLNSFSVHKGASCPSVREPFCWTYRPGFEGKTWGSIFFWDPRSVF